MTGPARTTGSPVRRVSHHTGAWRPRLARAGRLTASDWLGIGQAWALLLAADLALRLFRFKNVTRWLSRQDCRDTSQEPQIGPLLDRVDTAARHHLYQMTCLRRALVLQWLLCRRGIVTKLQIGVKKDPSGIRAHAWLQCGELSIDPGGDRFDFKPLERLGGSAEADAGRPSTSGGRGRGDHKIKKDRADD